MLTYRQLLRGLQELGLTTQSSIIAHIAFDEQIAGGAETVIGALLACCERVMMPSFTPQTRVVPPFGPDNNAMDYAVDGQSPDLVRFDPDLPADPSLGIVAETLRMHPQAKRSDHPLLSFSGVNVQEGLALQSPQDPWAPIRWMAEKDADILLMGVDHRRNISLHYALQNGGRKQFTRWAAQGPKIVACPGWPGCSQGFSSIAPHLEGVVRNGAVGSISMQMIPLRDLIHIAVGWVREDPQAMLCDRADCVYCQAVRLELGGSGSAQEG